jgi:hypothetical protein
MWPPELLAARMLITTALADAPDEVRAAFDALVADHDRALLAETNLAKERDELLRIVRSA